MEEEFYEIDGIKIKFWKDERYKVVVSVEPEMIMREWNY